MSGVLSIYDVLTDRLTDIKKELVSLRDEQISQGKTIAGLKAQFVIVYMFVFGIAMTIIKLWISGVNS